MEKYQLSRKFHKPVLNSHVSSESNPGQAHTHQSSNSWLPITTMNFLTKLKKKSKGKKVKKVKDKLVTAGEFFIAGGLLTAGGNLVDSITGEDSSSTQISAGEVNWVNDQTRSLFEIKTNQRDTTSAFPWGILGYVLLGLGMTLMAIPAIRLIRWIRVSCGGGNDSIHEDKEIEEPATMRDAVKYHPEPEERLEYDSSQSRPSLSQRQLMLEQEARVNINMPVM